MGGACC